MATIVSSPTSMEFAATMGAVGNDAGSSSKTGAETAPSSSCMSPTPSTDSCSSVSTDISGSSASSGLTSVSTSSSSAATVADAKDIAAARRPPRPRRSTMSSAGAKSISVPSVSSSRSTSPLPPRGIKQQSAITSPVLSNRNHALGLYHAQDDIDYTQQQRGYGHGHLSGLPSASSRRNPRAGLVRSNTTNTIAAAGVQQQQRFHSFTTTTGQHLSLTSHEPSHSQPATSSRRRRQSIAALTSLAEYVGLAEPAPNSARPSMPRSISSTGIMTPTSATSTSSSSRHPFVGADDDQCDHILQFAAADDLDAAATTPTSARYPTAGSSGTSSSASSAAQLHLQNFQHQYANYPTSQQQRPPDSAVLLSSPASMSASTSATTSGHGSAPYQPFPEWDRQANLSPPSTSTSARYNDHLGDYSRNISGANRRHSVDVQAYRQQQILVTSPSAHHHLSPTSSTAQDPRFRKASLGSQTLLNTNTASSSGLLGSPPSEYRRNTQHLSDFDPYPTVSINETTVSPRDKSSHQSGHRWLDAPVPRTSSNIPQSTSSNSSHNMMRVASSSPSALPSTLPGNGQRSAGGHLQRSPTRSRHDSLHPPSAHGHGHSHSVSGLPSQQSSSHGYHPRGNAPGDFASHSSVPQTRFDMANRDATQSNQLEAKIVLLGRQGVGKTSLVHRYMTGQFSSSLPTTIGASFLVKKLIMDGVKVRLQIWDTAGQERFRSMAPMYYRGAHAAILVYDLTSPDSLEDIKVWLDELQRNMSSDLIVHIVGCKADLAPEHRRVHLEDARIKISEWLNNAAIANHADGGVSSTSSGAGSAMGETSDSHNVNNSRYFGSSFGLSRTQSRSKVPQPTQPPEPVWKDMSISEVSAKEDEGIEDLFLSIASRLVERKVQIAQDRILRTKDSVMISDKKDEQRPDDTRIWGCC